MRSLLIRPVFPWVSRIGPSSHESPVPVGPDRALLQPKAGAGTGQVTDLCVPREELWM